MENPYLRKCEQQQAPSTECVDRKDCGECEDKVDQSKAKGSDERIFLTRACVPKDRRRVKCDDVDSCIEMSVKLRYEGKLHLSL